MEPVSLPKVALNPEKDCVASLQAFFNEFADLLSSNATAPDPTIADQFYERSVAEIAGDVFIAQADATTRSPACF